MIIEFDKKVTLPGHVLKRESDGEAVLLNIKTEQYHGLDENALNFLEALISCSTIAEAMDQLSSEYDVSLEQLKEDLTVFIRDLIDKELLLINDKTT